MKSKYGQVLVVDNGGFFPEDDLHKDVSWFLMDGMKVLGLQAIGVADRDLRFGVGWLQAHQKRTGLPLVSANLMMKATGRPAFQPHVVTKVGTVKVGVFGLISDKVDLGPARDSLTRLEPQAAAKAAVAELRKKGAQVIVLLSNLGKVESEDLVTAVPGIDAVVVGRNTPLLMKGRMIGKTVAVYGGEQGQYFGKTTLALGPKRNVVSGDAESVMLGPEVGERKDIGDLVKSFEDSFNEKLRVAEKERAAQNEASLATANADHYLGSEVCMRCHVQEAEQWKTTKHALAWETLVEAKKDATPDCIPCHVVGYQQNGGFQTSVETPQMVDVGCESCHGMGTQHEAFPAAPRQMSAAVCMTCHTEQTSPTFKWETHMPHVAHAWTGEKPVLPPNPAKAMMKAGKVGH
jgi:hypothetical protein